MELSVTSFGPSSTSKEHTHEIFFYNKATGEGFTGPGGESDHAHRIEGFSIQPRVDLNGTQHLHTIPEDIKKRLLDDAN